MTKKKAAKKATTKKKARVPKDVSLVTCPHCGEVLPPEVFEQHSKLDAQKRGKKGGKTTAKKGPDHYRKLQSLRKSKRGGRPRKDQDKK